MYLVVLSYPKPTQIKIKSSFFPSFVALSSGTAASEHVDGRDGMHIMNHRTIKIGKDLQDYPVQLSIHHQYCPLRHEREGQECSFKNRNT